MLAIFNSLNAHNFPIYQLILMILVSKFMVHRAVSDNTNLPLGLLSPLKTGLDYIRRTNFSLCHSKSSCHGTGNHTTEPDPPTHTHTPHLALKVFLLKDFFGFFIISIFFYLQRQKCMLNYPARRVQPV